VPSQTKHIAQARHNHQFWSSFDLASTPFPDWVVTGMFYESIHWVEAFLSSRGEHSTRHSLRTSAMRRHKKEMGPVMPDLETLKVESENARYGCYKHTPKEISSDLVPLVRNIESHIQNIFNPPATTS
jgi:hypothetical protein